MFKEARFVYEEALPAGVSCSPGELEAMKAKYAGKSVEQRQEISRGVLDSKEGGGCSAYEKRLAQEEFFKSRKERKAAIDAKYGRILLSSKDSDGKIRAEYQAALDVLDTGGTVPLVTGLFETLPVSEQGIIKDLEVLQKRANKAYWEIKDHPSLKLSLGELRNMQNVSAKDLKVESGQIYDWQFENAGQMTKILDDQFRSDLWVSYGNFESVDPGYPSDRLYNRQLGITFIRERGADMSPNYRALGYINFAISLMHKDIKERDLALAGRCLDEAIRLMEPYLVSDQYRQSDYESDWESVLEAAYVRKAAILAEKQEDKKKADPQVVELYKKAIKTDKHGGTYEAYFNYMKRFGELSLEEKVKIIDANRGEAQLTIMDRVLRSYRQRVVESTSLKEYNKRLEQLKKLADRWRLGDVGGPAFYHGLERLTEWFGKDSTPAKRREMLGEFFDEDVREEMLNRIEKSPIEGRHYRDLVLGNEGQAEMNVYKLNQRRDFLWDLGTPARVKLFQARLLDDLSPEGMVDRKRAFDYYRKALADRHGLSRNELELAVTRCYRIINGPDMFASKDYDVYGEVGSALKMAKDGWLTIDNPDDLVVLYYDEQKRVGVAVNRYLNLPLSAYFAEDDYREVRQKLRDLRKDGKGETEDAKTLETKLAALRKELNPEAAGKIVLFMNGSNKDRKDQVVVDFEHPIYELKKDKGFPKAGFNLGSLELDSSLLMTLDREWAGKFLVDGSKDSTISFDEFIERQNLPKHE